VSRISYLGRSYAYGHLEDGAGAGAEEDGAADLADDRGHLAGLVGGERARMEAVFVAEGKVVEQVLDGFDAALVEPGGDAVADSFHVLDRGAEIEGHGLDASRGYRAIKLGGRMK
jgi:hypothetical protein